MNNSTIKSQIIQKSEALGFLACGFSVATCLETERNHLQDWLNRGFQGEMGYMENHFEKRLDPTLLVEGAKTVISLAYNYFPQKLQKINAPKVAKYAFGEDYHKVVKDQGFLLLEYIKTLIPEAQGRVFVDSAPVMERQWAEQSGIGWIGKNSLIIRKGIGSFFFLAEIICNIEIKPDKPTTDHCGSCTACIDACPTDAIVSDQVIDATKCISYLTIEKRTEILPEEKQNLNQWIFGCDICQDVCPWNRFSVPTQEERFIPSGDWLDWETENWKSMNSEQFANNLEKTPITRAGFEKIKRLLP
jgi:epoxyqueuosine reductase